jgi:hypothetical protein
VYVVYKVQMALPERCVSATTLVRNCGATNVARTQKDKPLLSVKTRPHLQTHKQSWNKYKLIHWFRWGSKLRTTVLSRTSSKFLNWTVKVYLQRVNLVSVVGTRQFALNTGVAEKLTHFVRYHLVAKTLHIASLY